ncbi:MAG: DNA mismatch repair protein MutS [Thermoguttaceae bacterium]|nr:DNA mismatch repair protein MutS [Thermoguttaceae bacterium]
MEGMHGAYESLTPMMRQYQEAKRACGDALLLFRMGDFYELFYEDAKTAARLLNLALTSREKGENAIPMAGFPHHQLEHYLAKLISAGLRVAVCEQVEDPKLAKGLVRREITRVVTAGTITEETLLDPRSSNYLAAISPGEPAGLAWVELSTGRFQAAAFPRGELADQLARIGPSECLLAEGEALPAGADQHRMMLTRRPPWAFNWETACQILRKHFGLHSLEGFGFTDSPEDRQAIRAAGAILDYLTETQKTSLAHLDRLLPYRRGSVLEIDQSTRRSLEITRTLREGRREGSLAAVLDRTVTPMGARLWAEWLSSPLTDIAAINQRLDAVEELYQADRLRNALRESLQRVYDLERLLARITTGRATPRDLSFLAKTLRMLPELELKLAGRTSRLLQQIQSSIDPCLELQTKLDAALVEDCPLSSREGGFIRTGFCPELDELRDLAQGGKQWIAQYQAHEIQRTGIPTLKVGFNKVFGYYIEVTNTHRDKIPEDYIRKQTLKNAERFITPELKQYEERVLTADEKARALEYELFCQLREEASAARARLQQTAAALAQLDVVAALAELARQRNYCRPRLVEEPILLIRDGRHPVLDILEPEGAFVPNDTELGVGMGEGKTIALVTGPNMAGKSTYIRQVALLVLLAQTGSFIPAKEAVIGVADRIFARVGASDELARGQSTFMVEMTETARICHLATRRSLVVLDEIGRGTSTYDGISLAWAVAEYLHDRIQCRTLFATHYHELTDLERHLPGVMNLNVAVREWQDEVIFLHKILPGAADKSYGIHVARLAGVPRPIIERAKDVLVQLEDERLAAETAAWTTLSPPTSPIGEQHPTEPIACPEAQSPGGVFPAQALPPEDRLEACPEAQTPDRPPPASQTLLGFPSQTTPHFSAASQDAAPVDSHRRSGSGSRSKIPSRPGGYVQLTLFQPMEHPILDELRRLDLDKMPPLEALLWLKRWQEKIK